MQYLSFKYSFHPCCAPCVSKQKTESSITELQLIYFLFLTGAYFVLPVTTPGLDFQLFKTLITASNRKELGSSQHNLDSLIVEHFVDPLCFWNKAIICSPELSAATEKMTRLAQQEAIQVLLVDCCAKSELLWQLSTVLYTVSAFMTAEVVSLSCRCLVGLDILDDCIVYPRD